MMSGPRLMALVLAGATLAAGCGASATLTHSQLIAKAEPICSRANAKLAAVLSATKPQDISRAAGEFAAYDRIAAAELEKLTPPSSMAGDWKAIISAYRTAGKVVSQLGREALVDKGRPSVAAVREFSHIQADRQSLASNAGFKECAR